MSTDKDRLQPHLHTDDRKPGQDSHKQEDEQSKDRHETCAKMGQCYQKEEVTADQ
ncbi:MAG: hypothetical protein HKP51_09995 [Sulfitobacter sp.]|nr:hypothetical protein [Sulfitobacter sp.]